MLSRKEQFDLELKPFLSWFIGEYDLDTVYPNRSREKTDFNLELPFAGLSKKDIKIETAGNVLSIKVNDNIDGGYQSKYKNRHVKYNLGNDYDLTLIEATMQNGLLSVKIPLKKECQPQEIAIR